MSHAHDLKETSNAYEGIEESELQDESYVELESVVTDDDSEAHTTKDEYAYEIHYVDQYKKDSHVDFDEETLLNVSELFGKGSYMRAQEDSKHELDMLLSDGMGIPNIYN